MEQYSLIELVTPWAELAVLLLLLWSSERWIHQHAFGVGYLLSQKNALAATRAFYVFFSPGVFVHEMTQYLMAGFLGVPIKRLVAWPEKQSNGTLRLDFIVVERAKTDLIRAALVAASPFIVMVTLIWYLSTQMLNLDGVIAALGVGETEAVMQAVNALLETPAFLFWAYLLFVIANSMLPKREDARGWPIILGLLGIISAVMVVIGLDQALIETLGGPVRETLDHINTALLGVLLLNLGAILALILTESILEYRLGERMDYSGGEKLTRNAADSKKRQPGSDAPYPKGQPVPSIYNPNFHLTLPLPEANPAPKAQAAPAAPPPPGSSMTASRSPLGGSGFNPTPRPALTPTLPPSPTSAAPAADPREPRYTPLEEAEAPPADNNEGY